MTEPDLEGNELTYLTECIRSGWVSSKGSFIQRFEQAMASWCQVHHSVATSSGTGALHLALLALGVGPGDEVIVPALSYVASANTVAYVGARPVFIDIDPATWNLDLTQLFSKITPRTRAIMAVHLLGHPVEMAPLMRLAAGHGLWVIEDACEAHGSEYNGRPVGGLGHVGCFSFYGNKLITTGEGGMLVTDSDELAGKARSLRNQACTADSYWHTEIGYNYRMTNLQAALGLAQLERVDHFIAARREIVRAYDEQFKDIPGFCLYREPTWSRSICWLYSLLVDGDFGVDRNRLITCLAQHGIESKPFFKPLPGLPAFRNGCSYPVAEHVSSTGISLPTFGKLSPEQITYIGRVVKEVASG